MLIYVAVLRVSPTSLKQPEKNFKNNVEILLTCKEGDNSKKAFPFIENIAVTTTKLNIRQIIGDYICKATQGCSEYSLGLKIKRIIHATTIKINVGGLLMPVSLYVAPTLGKPCENAPLNTLHTTSFYRITSIRDEISHHRGKYTEETSQLLEAVSIWLKEKFSKEFGYQSLFRPIPLDRIMENISNPAYATELNRDWFLLENKLAPDQAMQKMKMTDRCDMIVHNPLTKSIAEPYNKVNGLIVNKFYGMGKLDYSKIKVPDRDQWFKGQGQNDENRELSWVEEFPAHRAAADGDVATLDQFLCLDMSLLETWDHDGWAPIHYACWHGRVDAVSLLIERGCDPNLCNRNKTSLLHLSAGCGHWQIVKILCDHPLLDRMVLDKQDRTASECCEQIRSKDWNKCMQFLKDLNHKPFHKLMIHRMDGTEKALELRHGSNTTVLDIITNLNLPEEAVNCFSLWITSKSLHLQLKPDHSPPIEMQKWPEILHQLSGINWESCKEEKPRIVLKRDVHLLPTLEETVTDIFSIKLLYEEARAQVIRGLYPCSDQVAVAMAAIVARIQHGPFDTKKHKLSYFNENLLRQLFCVSKLRNRTVNWAQKLTVEYKEISEQGPGELSQLELLYLRYCWTQIPTYGSAFFTGYALATKHTGEEKIQRIVPLYIGVNHRGIHFVKVENKALLISVSFHSSSYKLFEQERLFQIRTNDDKINMVIHTPQAALVCSLMGKLNQETKINM